MLSPQRKGSEKNPERSLSSQASSSLSGAKSNGLYGATSTAKEHEEGDDAADARQRTEISAERKLEKGGNQGKRKRAPAQAEFDCQADFLAFDDDTVAGQFALKTKMDDNEEMKNSDANDLSGRMSKKYDPRNYPWLSNETMRVKDIHIKLH